MIEAINYKGKWTKTGWKSFDKIKERSSSSYREFKDETYVYLVVAFKHKRSGKFSGEIYRQPYLKAI